MKWLALALAVAFVPNIHAGAVAPRWGILALTVPALLFLAAFRGRLRFRPEHTVGGLFFLVALLGVDWTRPDQLNATIQLSLVGGVFVLAQFEANIWNWLGWGLALSGVIVVAQWSGERYWVEASPPAALFANKNILAEAAALALIPAVIGRKWVLVGFLLPAVVFTECREAWAALSVAGALWLWHNYKRGLLVLLPLAALGLALTLDLHPNHARLGILESTWAVLDFNGHGLGLYYVLFPVFDTHGDPFLLRSDHAHNEYLELLFEIGPVGLAFFLALVAWAFRFGRGIELYILAALLVEAMFGFPFHMPVTAFCTAWTLGRLCSHGPSVRQLLVASRVAVKTGLDFGKNRLDQHSRGGIST